MKDVFSSHFEMQKKSNDGVSIPNKQKVGFFHNKSNDSLLSSFPLEHILPYTLQSTPVASVQQDEKVWVVTAMLCRYLETFTDGIIVMNEKVPLGILGGRELLARLIRNPTLEFFDNYSARQVMTEHVNIISPKTTLGELLSMMIRQRIGIAIIPYSDNGYSSISVRTLLEVAAVASSDMMVSEIPKKNIITINHDHTIKDAILTMFQYQTRKLIFEDFSTYISDRGIIEKIAFDLDYLSHSPDFLNMKANLFNPKSLRKLDKDMKVTTLAKIMLGMDVPYVLVNDQIISPWDIAMLLK